MKKNNKALLLIPIIPRLYISPESTAQNVSLLLDTRITHILSVGAGKKGGSYPEHFSYLRIGIRDKESEDIVDVLPVCIDFIENALIGNGSVLVHCKTGRSRSAGVIIGYLMYKNPSTTTFESALAMVRNARSIVQPNPSFVLQLKAYRESLLKKLDDDDDDCDKDKDKDKDKEHVIQKFAEMGDDADKIGEKGKERVKRKVNDK